MRDNPVRCVHRFRPGSAALAKAHTRPGQSDVFATRAPSAGCFSNAGRGIRAPCLWQLDHCPQPLCERSQNKVWLLAKIDKTLRVAANYVVEPYALMANSHDGSMAF